MIKLCLVCNSEKEFGRRAKAATCEECNDKGLKYCVGCNTVKDLDQYTKSGTSYRKMCRPCDAAENREQFNKRYKERPDEMRAMQREYKKTQHYKNKDNAIYKAKNSHKALNYTHKRLGAKGAHTFSQWKETMEAFNNSCVYCGSTEGTLEKDHIVPISKGGTDFISNVVPACRSCNSSKGNKDVVEWYTKQPFYNEEVLEAL